MFLPLSNSILKILNILDINITFHDDFLSEELINNKRSLVFFGYLDSKPDCCFKCGVIKDDRIIKYGTKISRVKMMKISGLDIYLDLKKQKYFCYHCNHSFISITNVVDYRCHISNNTKKSVINDAKKIKTNLDIARDHNISNMTV